MLTHSHWALAALGIVALGSSAAAQPTGRQQDIARVRNIVTTIDKSWTDSSRALGLARLDALARVADTISPLRFDLEVARVIALGDNGHSSVPAGLRAGRANRTRVRLSPFGTSFYVLRAAPEAADLLGARLVAIEGISADSLRKVAHTLSPGTAAWRDRSVAYLLESPEQLGALRLIARTDSVLYRFERPDGRLVDRRLRSDTAGALRPNANARRWMMAPPDTGDGGGWQALRREAQLPWSLREPLQPYRFEYVRELDAMVVDIRQNNDAQNRLAGFLDSARAEIARVKPRRAILDMRLNGGGNLQITRDFVQSLPTQVPGEIFVITSPYTFSAAISTVGYLEQAAPARVTIVGEEVGDRLDFFAEGGPQRLPSSGLSIGVATQRHDYMNGCRQYTDCHPPVVRFPIAVPTLTPDIAAPWTIQAYMAGQDPAMDAIRAAIRRRGSGDGGR